MGKNITIYFDDECCELIEKIEGKGTLINQLVKEHFSNDEEVLQRKLKAVDIERTLILKKLDEKQNIKARLNALKTKESDLTKAQRTKQQVKDFLLKIYQEDKITDDQYNDCFDINGLIFNKAMDLINGMPKENKTL